MVCLVLGRLILVVGFVKNMSIMNTIGPVVLYDMYTILLCIYHTFTNPVKSKAWMYLGKFTKFDHVQILEVNQNPKSCKYLDQMSTNTTYIT